MKLALRASMLARRAALSPEERRRSARAVADRLKDLPPFRAAQTVLGYHALPDELDVAEWLQGLALRGRTLALPRVQGSNLVVHRWAPGDALERGPMGVMEPLRSAPVVAPSTVDVALIPGVAFDRAGHRLGFGRGYFDRFLAASPEATRVGVGFDFQVVDALPRESHDVPMDWVVTPGSIIRNARPIH